MSCRDETFNWRSPATDAPDFIEALVGLAAGGEQPSAPAGQRTERICRTLHGPVQRRAGDRAFARRYAIWGREIETLVGLSALNDARTIADVDRAMQQVTWNENVIAADDRGSIGYWHPGLHPLRPRRWDERLPYPGTGEAEWRGLLPRRRTPYVIDPAQGWLTNWNNVPSIGWTNGDAPARERLAGRLHRVGIIESLVSRVARRPSHAASRDIVRRSGTTAQQRPLFTAGLRAAEAAASGRARDVLRALLAWDGSYHRTDPAGTVDPGVAIWEEFKHQARGLALNPMGAGAELLDGGTGSSHAFDISNGEAYALTRLSPGALARAADGAGAALTQRFGTPNIAAWREPRRPYRVSAMGAGDAPDLFFFDRGTWEQAVSLGP